MSSAMMARLSDVSIRLVVGQEMRSGTLRGS